MALHPLLDLISREGVEPPMEYVARWTETPASGWDPEPSYGSFVDEEGRVIAGKDEVLVSLDSDDTRYLRVDAVLEAGFPEGCAVVFLDWGRQPLSWEEIFGLWEAWDSQGMVVGCGAVGVPWRLSRQWVSPGWIAFRDGFDGSPLSTVLRTLRPAEVELASVPASDEAPPLSFLARAQRLRGEEASVSAGERLPMLPFTLESLQDSSHQWPVGVA